jgi:hypothetical protein
MIWNIEASHDGANQWYGSDDYSFTMLRCDVTCILYCKAL